MKKLYFLVFWFIPAFLFSQEENITFPSGGIDLRGTISIPQGDGPFPAVILVHGSGPGDRDQTYVFGDPTHTLDHCIYPALIGHIAHNFKDIADYLSANGILVLRYDKRSNSHPQTLNPVTVSVFDFIPDIENAIAYLKTRTEVDPACIILAGHSQGSGLIAAVENGRSDVSGLISLAGAVTPIDTIIAEQNRDVYTICFGNPGAGENIANQWYLNFYRIRAGLMPLNQQMTIIPPGTTNPLPAGYPIFFRDWIMLTDSTLANYRDFNVPTLIIHGKEDFNVPYEEAYKFEAGLDPQLTQVNVFDGVTHFLGTQVNPNVTRRILDTMVDWIKNVKTTSSAGEKIEKESDVNIFQKDNMLIISFEENQFTGVQISDLTGKVLFKKEIEHQNRLEIPLSGNSSILVVSLFSEEKGVYSKKVFIK